MSIEETIRKVQTKLNRFSLYTLGRLLAHAKKDDAIYQQILIAMSPELDSKRMDDQQSADYIRSGRLYDNKWIWEE